MTTYKDSGVDINAGDSASKNAYKRASETFKTRKGKIGEPVLDDGGFAGLLDMGDYYLIQSTDGTGTKIDLAAQINKYDSIGYDLLAMVSDDAICVGAEIISITNCIDVPKVDPQMIDEMMKGLANACTEQSIAIPAGEIAEVPGAVSRAVWSASAIGIVEKDKVINPKSIKEGDAVIALKSGVVRSNGLSLVRKIMSDAHGEDWNNKEWKDGTNWGEILLTPSIVYHNAILSLIGRYKEERKVDVKGIAHITGGGIPSKFRRVLKKNSLGADLNNLYPAHPALLNLIELGSVPMEEAYKTWNMGNGMLLVVAPEDAERSIELLSKQGITAQIAGIITSNPEIAITDDSGNELKFN
ncbi:phosphoribosylformylglycinamidine cyclo-ligase [Candidatus Peregrinibacteria bacterium]|nr:phosphoribosylformylglycinamidine cyclo-ligase [Candidatus Peregrinibacteria bacterium]